MIKAIILRGMPLSGKSTWVKNHLNKEKPKNFFIIDSEVDYELNQFKGIDITQDAIIYFVDCNLEDSEVEEKITFLNTCNITNITVISLFDVSLEELLTRNELAGEPIVPTALKSLYKRSRPTMLNEKLKRLNYLKEHPREKRNAIIVDLDGTIAINTSNRPFFGEGSEEGYLKDTPVKDLINMIKLFAEKEDLDIIILTGRNGTHLGLTNTVKWLNNNGVPFKRMYTRDIGDFSSADVYKEKQLNKILKDYHIRMVFEDDVRCIKMFRDYGLLTIAPSDGHL